MQFLFENRLFACITCPSQIFVSEGGLRHLRVSAEELTLLPVEERIRIMNEELKARIVRIAAGIEEMRGYL